MVGFKFPFVNLRWCNLVYRNKPMFDYVKNKLKNEDVLYFLAGIENDYPHRIF